MLRGLLLRLTRWSLERKIERAQRRSIWLSEEYERITGEPFRLTPDELRRLADASRGMDLDQLREISDLHPDGVEKLIVAVRLLQDDAGTD